MKKTIIALFVALTAAMALNAQSYTGPILVIRNGQTNTETATVTVEQQSDGLNKLILAVPFMNMNLILNMTNVPSATTDGITTFSAEQTVATGTVLGSMYTILFARVTNGMMAADVAIPAYGVTMWFNTVGDHFQLPNSDFEAWNADNGEPDRWHSFKTAKGTLASMAANGGKLMASDDVHAGSTGQHSAMITTGRVFGVLANGTMTNGQLNAGGVFATDPKNHAEMDKTSTTTDALGEKFYMPIYAKPDAFKLWMKYVQGSTNDNYKATVSVKTFDGTYYQEPEDTVYTNLSGSIVGGQITACDWTEFTFPMDYETYAANNAATEAIFVTFSTNAIPGQGNDGDAVYVDDMELVYLATTTDLCYQGTTIEGWDPAVTTYNMQITGTPNLDDFTATVEGASAVVTKSMEQNADGSWRIVISAVSGDLQMATAYIINVTVSTVLRGDVDGNGVIGMDDLTALINYLVFNTTEGINLENADVDAVGGIGMDDLTALINYLVYGHF